MSVLVLWPKKVVLFLMLVVYFASGGVKYSQFYQWQSQLSPKPLCKHSKKQPGDNVLCICRLTIA